MTLETLHCVVFVLFGCCCFCAFFLITAVILGRGGE